MVMYISILGLVLLVLVPVVYSRMTQGYADEIRRIESALSILGVKKEDGEAEVARLAAEEDEMRRRRIKLMETEQTLPSLGGGGPSGPVSTPEEYLLSVGLITEKDLDKARGYKSGSRSEYDLGEILIMMDVIDSSDWVFAKSKVKA